MRKFVVLLAMIAFSSSLFAQSRDGSCIPIDSMIVVDTLGNLSIHWSANDTTLAFDFSYRLLGDTSWICETTLDTFFVIEVDEECIEFEVGVNTICPFDTSGFMIDTIISFCPSDTSEIDVPDDPSVLSIYPVPFDSELTISSSGSDMVIKRVIIRNLEGQVILSSFNENQLNLDAANWPRGLYIIEVETNQSQEIRKVLKL